MSSSYITAQGKLDRSKRIRSTPPPRISIDLKQRMHMPLSPTIRILGQTSGEYAIK